MDGIDKIIQRLEEDAAEELRSIVQSGEKKVATIRDAYQKQADAAYQALIEKGKLEAAERVERLHSVAELEARKQLLAEKQNGIDMAFDQARAQLAALPQQEKIALYVKLILGASIDGQEAVVLSPADRQSIGEAVVATANQQRPNAAFRLSERTEELDGGLLLSSQKMDVNCSFDSLLQALRQSMAAELSVLLYE